MLKAPMYSPTHSDTSGLERATRIQQARRDNNHQIEAFAASKPEKNTKKVKKSYRKPGSTASKDTWHRRLGHVSIEAIGHLPEALI